MTCAACHQPACGHPDATYRGGIPAPSVVTIDTASPTGSWDRALRHRAQIDAARRPHAEPDPSLQERNHA